MAEKVKAGTVTLALGLVGIGLGMLVYNFGGLPSLQNIWKLWPLLLICLGLEYFIRRMWNKESEVVFHIPSVLLIGAVVLAGSAASAVYSADIDSILDDTVFRERISYTRHWQAEPFTPAEGSRLELENENGTLRIRASEDGILRATAEIISYGSTEEKARTEAESKEIIIEKGMTTRIIAEREGTSRGFNGVVNLTVEIPPGLIVLAQSSNGSIEADNAEGRFTVRTENGKVNLRDLDGSLEVKSENGRITAAGISGNISAATENGEIRIENPGGDVVAESENGAIELASERPLDKNYFLQSMQGKLNIRLPNTSNLEIEARTSHGRISGMGADSNAGAVQSGSDRLKLGTGNGSARLITENGSIQVNTF
ncbi:DUF4097 family beta strand repeat-containing protein [Pelotomaculum propionicicum]|uniref:DUF4097 family beta strand repeat-containing protein n=1 Tax=Pelotomaculum propionicicum TaxID=258475 RepID=UPI003B7F6D56